MCVWHREGKKWVVTVGGLSTAVARGVGAGARKQDVEGIGRRREACGSASAARGTGRHRRQWRSWVRRLGVGAFKKSKRPTPNTRKLRPPNTVYLLALLQTQVFRISAETGTCLSFRPKFSGMTGNLGRKQATCPSFRPQLSGISGNLGWKQGLVSSFRFLSLKLGSESL